MTVGRRPPGPVPGFERMLRIGGPQDLRRAGAKLEEYLRHMAECFYSGLPASSGDTSNEDTIEDSEFMAWIAFQRADEDGAL